MTKTDHDFVNLDIKPLASGAASATPSKTATAGKPVLKKAAIGLAAAVTALGAATTTSSSTGRSTTPTADATQQGGTLTTTFHHPFYDITQAAFIDAEKLKPGDELQNPHRLRHRQRRPSLQRQHSHL